MIETLQELFNSSSFVVAMLIVALAAIVWLVKGFTKYAKQAMEKAEQLHGQYIADVKLNNDKIVNLTTQTTDKLAESSIHNSEKYTELSDKVTEICAKATSAIDNNTRMIDKLMSRLDEVSDTNKANAAICNSIQQDLNRLESKVDKLESKFDDLSKVS